MEFIKDISKIMWNSVLEVKNAKATLCMFMDLFINACDKHAPMKKTSVKNIRTPWLITN